ncbi:urease accessory protein UreD [Afifella aestuarii]|uniref:urease accessory protein UreD n=1 Tax=Afifella aestuarii TaxID=1909496 RepID=UPI000FE3FF7F|nr:urease accessory protein UreD [Afifella aestuarii]
MLRTSVDTSDRATAPARLQRVEAEARIAFKRDGGVTRLDRLFHQGSVKWRLPHVPAGMPPEAVVINTAGGLTGGDRFSVTVEMGEATTAVVMTPACERLYRAAGGVAEIDVHLDLAAGATLYWLPQETIAFEGAACHRRITAEFGDGARLLALESTLLGRRAMGERVTRADLRESWRVRRSGRLIHADELALRGDLAELDSARATLAGGSAFASLVLVAEDCEPLVDHLRAALGPGGGASAFNGKILARLVAEDGLALRRHLVPALRILLADCPLPKIWTL